jgi:DNA-binding NarL/FixJ family response regulator
VERQSQQRYDGATRFDKFQVVGSFGDCLAVENQVRTLKPDIILMDIDMPGRNGIVGVGLVKKTDPSV